MPRLVPSLFIALLLVASFAACSEDEDSGGDLAGSGRLNVVATTVQIGALTSAVAGDLVQVTVLVKPGVDPHEFDPNPDDLRKLGDSRVVFRNGLGLDDWLDKAIKNAGGTKRLVTVTDGLKLRDGRGEKAKDPHVWHDPVNDKAMIDAIEAALSKADTKNAPTYKANAAAAKARFDDVDRQIRALIDAIPAPNRKVVTDHDAFGYFLERYGLTFVGAVIPSVTTQAEPSAKDIAQLEDLIRREKVKAIFSEETASPRLSQRIAADTGAKVIDTLLGDSLGDPGSGQETVEGMLLFNAKTIAEALK